MANNFNKIVCLRRQTNALHDVTYNRIVNDSITKNEFDNDLLVKRDYTFSKIMKCKINNKVISITKYNGLFIHLLTNTNVNIDDLINNYQLGILSRYYGRTAVYYEKLGVYIRGVNANTIIKKIIRLVILYNFKIELTIKLKNNEIICIQNNA
jgi:hypothetical protein